MSHSKLSTNICIHSIIHQVVNEWSLITVCYNKEYHLYSTNDKCTYHRSFFEMWLLKMLNLYQGKCFEKRLLDRLNVIDTLVT